MGKLIINADDLGLSKGVNEGILSTYKEGVVNSASLMVNMHAFEDAVAVIKNNSLEGIGLHFNFTEGIALTNKLRTIVDKDGNFLRDFVNIPNLNHEEIYLEMEAQFHKATKAGVNISHLDSHHHVHMAPKVRATFLDFAIDKKLPIRRIHNTLINPIKIVNFFWQLRNSKFYTEKFVSSFYGGNAKFKNLEDIILQNRGKNLEIMCHPGFLDSLNGEYDRERQLELDILCSKEVKSLISQF